MNTDDEQKKEGFLKRIFSSKSKKKKKYQDSSQELNNYNDYFSDGYLENDSDNYSDNKINNSNNLYNNINNSNGNIYEKFYSTSDNKKELEQEEYNNEPPKKGKKKFLLIILLLIILGALVWLLITMMSKKDLSDINLLVSDISLKVGENKYISYEMVNVTDVIKVSFESADTSVATVDENGNVLGISEGKTTVSLKYKTGSKDKEKICNIEVIDDGKNTENPNTDPKNEEPKNNPTPTIPQTPPNLTVSASTTSWTNKDVTIKASASSNAGGSVSLSYAINCSTNCNYTKTNGTITVSNNGTNTITVVATDSKNNKQAIKSVTVKIDKEAPTVSVKNYQSKYESKTGIQVCATCSDKGSGCKEPQTCEIYTKTAYNQTIQVQDNAGNIGKSKSFDIIINK